jgi:hypothetical protein
VISALFTALYPVLDENSWYGHPRDFLAYGQIIQVMIALIMAMVFITPLIKSTSSSSSSSMSTSSNNSNNSAVLREVVIRTIVGAVLHLIFTILFVLSIFSKQMFEENFDQTTYEVLFFTSANFPLLINIALSHRDDKPLSFAFYELYKFTSNLKSSSLTTFVRVCDYLSGAVKLYIEKYSESTIDTYDSEYDEIIRLSIRTASTGLIRHEHSLSVSSLHQTDNALIVSSLLNDDYDVKA